MYHYVRDHSIPSDFKFHSLDVKAFDRQLDWFEERYTFVKAEQVLGAISGRGKLPENALWLTFDDGYSDHYEYVFPRLADRGLEGTFFVPSQAMRREKLLAVNAIHYLLATQTEPPKLIEALEGELRRVGFQLDEVQSLKDSFEQPNRFDNASVNFFKRSLQKGISEPYRSKVISALLERFIDQPEPSLAADTYLTLGQMKEMVEAGMFFGGHGDSHLWFDAIEPEELDLELEGSLSVLRELGLSDQDWVLSYPYGAHSDFVRNRARSFGVALAVTTEPRVANMQQEDALSIPRFDTNDFPQ